MKNLLKWLGIIAIMMVITIKVAPVNATTHVQFKPETVSQLRQLFWHKTLEASSKVYKQDPNMEVNEESISMRFNHVWQYVCSYIFSRAEGALTASFAGLGLLVSMDLTLLADRPPSPITGGYDTLRFALAKDILTVPGFDMNNKAVVSGDFEFKPGKGWYTFYATPFKYKLVNKDSGKIDNDAVEKTLTVERAGIDDICKQFLAENRNEPMYILVQQCSKPYPELVGSKCSPARMAYETDSGQDTTDDRVAKITWTSKGPYVAPTYKGVITSNQGIIAANATHFDASAGTQFVTSANDVNTIQIVYLDTPAIGSTITIIGGSDVNPTIISKGGNFNIASNITLNAGSSITLFIVDENNYVEVGRSEVAVAPTVIPADGHEFDAATGKRWITSANTIATVIVQINNAVTGNTIEIIGGSNTEPTTITDGGDFSLTAAATMTLSVGHSIKLYVRGDNDFVEISRT